MRTTITLNDNLYRRLKIHSAETGESLSALVESAIKYQLLEDLDDIEAIEKRKKEPVSDFADFVKELKSDGLL